VGCPLNQGDSGLRSSVVRPQHPARKSSCNSETCDSGLRSSAVSPVHPCRKSQLTSVTCDSGVSFRGLENSKRRSLQRNKPTKRLRHQVERMYTVETYTRVNNDITPTAVSFFLVLPYPFTSARGATNIERPSNGRGAHRWVIHVIKVKASLQERLPHLCYLRQ
jgi:hypothetical protein